MGQSLCQILTHLVYSTKNRRACLAPALRPELFAVLGHILKTHGSDPIQIGGHVDHVHLFFNLGKQNAICDLVRDIKTDSCHWMKKQGVHDFEWQSGYAAFSISIMDKPRVIQYILNQDEHHKKQDFKAELLEMLQRAQMPYDEKYLWD